MPTPMMTARVDPEMVADLDALAMKRGTTRTAIVRAAIAVVLNIPEILDSEAARVLP